MPLYEFVCQSCDSEFEMIVSFSATESPACPTCKANDVQRKMGLPAIHFKGSGWYINDSKKSKDTVVGGGKEEASDNKNSDKESKSDGNSESESKTEKASTDTKSESTTKSSSDSSSSDSSSSDSSSKEKAKNPQKSMKSDK